MSETWSSALLDCGATFKNDFWQEEEKKIYIKK